jgi:alpha-mannosidase
LAVAWRPDQPRRPGWACPADPGAQCLGRHTFRYALVPHAGNYLTSQREAHAFNAPLRATSVVQAFPTTSYPEGPAHLPPAASFVQISPAAALLTALKPPQSGQGMILRVYNSAGTPMQARVRLWRAFGEITLVQLDESTTLAALAHDASEVAFPLRAKEIATLLIKG